MCRSTLPLNMAFLSASLLAAGHAPANDAGAHAPLVDETGQSHAFFDLSCEADTDEIGYGVRIYPQHPFDTEYDMAPHVSAQILTPYFMVHGGIGGWTDHEARIHWEGIHLSYPQNDADAERLSNTFYTLVNTSALTYKLRINHDDRTTWLECEIPDMGLQ